MGEQKGKMGLFDLEKQFAFYGTYHSNPVNMYIHIMFVWPIFFTALLLLYFTPALFHSNPIQHGFLVFNVGFLLTLGYVLFYLFLDMKAGSLAASLFFLCWVSSSFLAHHLGFSLIWKVVLAAQVFCWTGVVIGHGVFEKRAATLLDNLAETFVLEPFFVLLEALRIFIGYEPYPGLHAKVKAIIDAEIKQWQETEQKKIS